jgi:hypothetical protein
MLASAASPSSSSSLSSSSSSFSSPQDRKLSRVASGSQLALQLEGRYVMKRRMTRSFRVVFVVVLWLLRYVVASSSQLALQLEGR